jgi:hypothetical protein
VCIDGSVNESIMNHNGTQKYFLIKMFLGEIGHRSADYIIFSQLDTGSNTVMNLQVI